MDDKTKRRIKIAVAVIGVLFLAWLVWRCTKGKAPLLGSGQGAGSGAFFAQNGAGDVNQAGSGVPTK